MREADIVKRDIALTFDFIRFILQNPHVLKQIPDKSEVNLLTREFVKTAVDDETKRISKKRKTISFVSGRVFKKVGS